MSLDALQIERRIAIARQPRAIGEGVVSARRRGAVSAIGALRQSGSAKILFPHRSRETLEAVLLNTAGGVTGGDRFAWRATAEAGAALALSTQAAERAYRAQPGERAEVSTTLTVEAGATLLWAPQETILFNGAALRRRLSVDIAPDARLLAVEPIIFGRSAMGERLSSLRFSDQWRVRRAGALVYADALRIDGAAAAILSRPGVLNGGAAMASVLYVAPDAEAALATLRPLLPPTAGASLIRPGVLAARFAAADGFTLRRALIPALEALARRPLPQVWKL